MEQSKLIGLMRSFSTTEWRSFREFVSSPYFNKNPEVRQLCEWLATQAPALAGITREAAHAQLFPGQRPDDARLNHTMSFLSKLAEDFIGLEQYWKAPFSHQRNVLRALGERNLDKHYGFHLEKARRAIGKQEGADVAYFYEKYALEIYEAERLVRNAPRQFNESVQTATDNLDAFYLLEKLRRTCYMLSSQAILATPYNLQLVEEICRFTADNLDVLQSPAIEAYFHIFQLLTKTDPDKDFQALKLLLKNRAAGFGKEDLTDTYQYAINFCNIQFMKGREKYVKEAFDLYTVSIEAGILLENGLLSPWHFKNIVNLALKLKKYAWTEVFLAENTRLLSAEFQPDAQHYNFALLYYTTGRYKEALEHLNKVEFSDVHYSIGAKTMLCKIFYENDDLDALDSLLHAFNTYLRRNKLISENVRQAYLNFTQIVKKILRTPPTQFSQLLQELEKIQVIASKEWLLEILQRR